MQKATGEPGCICTDHAITSVSKQRGQSRADESYLTPEGLSAIKGQMRGVCFPALADTSQGKWDPEEAWQVKVIEGKKCLMFGRNAGGHFSRGVAGAMLRGQSRVSTLVTSFIDARITQGQNPWCENEGISLAQLMKANYAMWPDTGAARLFMVFGPKYLHTGRPTRYLRTDVPVMFKPPLTGAKVLRWECAAHTRKEAQANFQRVTFNAQNVVSHSMRNSSGQRDFQSWSTWPAAARHRLHSQQMLSRR